MIIKAEEARRRSLLHGELKMIMEQIQASIDHATENGHYETLLHVSNDIDPYLLDVLTKELNSLGYETIYKPSQPLDDLNIIWKVRNSL